MYGAFIKVDKSLRLFLYDTSSDRKIQSEIAVPYPYESDNLQAGFHKGLVWVFIAKDGRIIVDKTEQRLGSDRS